MTDEPDPRPNPRPAPAPDAGDDRGAPDTERERQAAADDGNRAVEVTKSAEPALASNRNGASARRDRARRLVTAGVAAHGEHSGRDVVPSPTAVPFGQDVLEVPAEPLDGEWVTLPRRSGPLRRATIVLVVLCLVVGITGFSVLRWVNREIHPPGDPAVAVEFTIEQGDTTNDIASNLAKADVIGNATVFRYWLRRQGGEQTFKAGDYDLFEHMDYPDLLDKLRAGPKPPVSITVQVLPGLTLAQMKVRLLESMPGFDPAELDEALRRPELDKPWIDARNLDGSQSREGVLFPDTYAIDEESASNEFAILKRMSDQMDRVLTDLDAETRANELGYSVYDVLKVASLIEEEAKVDEDRPKIARVIYNRLARGIPLGIDATTRYAVGKVSGEPLLQSDLDSDSPYNTRKFPGLPPTPISLPTRASIEAALNPTPNERWLYYVLTNENGVQGAHRFVNTAREFEEAKQVCIDLGLGCG